MKNNADDKVKSDFEKKKSKNAKLLVLGLVLTISILLIILSIGNFEEIFKTIQTTKPLYIVIAICVTLLYAFLTPIPLIILAKSHRNVPLRGTYVINMTENFFNGVTPFATGGQPFEIYFYSKLRVKPSKSTSLLMANFIIFMITTNVFAFISLFYYNRLVASINQIQWIIIFGFSMNFLSLLIIVGLATSKTFKKIIEKALLLLCKIKFINKFLAPKMDSLFEYFDQIQYSFKLLMSKKATFFLCFFTRFIIMGIYYTIPFFIIRAFHVNISFEELFFVMCGTSFATTMVVWLPTPGSSGGIEFAFKIIFISIAGVSSTVAYGGMLIWRLLTYYMLMLVSFIFYLYFDFKFSTKERFKLPIDKNELKYHVEVNRLEE